MTSLFFRRNQTGSLRVPRLWIELHKVRHDGAVWKITNNFSFVDDKGSHSLSGSSQARANYPDNGNSMEDLLNESDCINTPSISNDSEDNRLHKSDSVLSIPSSVSSQAEPHNSLSTDNPCQMRCANQKLETGYSCMGTQLHNINECRPYTVYGSPSLCHSKWATSEHSGSGYTPVYDRSFFSFDCNTKILKPVERKDVTSTEPKAFYFIQRRKPLTKKSSRTAVSLEINHNPSVLHSSSSTVTIKAPSLTSDLISQNESCNSSTHSSHSSINSNLSTKNIVIKYTPKRNSKTPRNRYTAPIHPSEAELELWPPCLQRTTSVHQTNNREVINKWW